MLIYISLYKQYAIVFYFIILSVCQAQWLPLCGAFPLNLTWSFCLADELKMFRFANPPSFPQQTSNWCRGVEGRSKRVSHQRHARNRMTYEWGRGMLTLLFVCVLQVSAPNDTHTPRCTEQLWNWRSIRNCATKAAHFPCPLLDIHYKCEYGEYS